MKEELRSEPIHILSLGAGVQSSTLALMAAAGEIGPMPACAIFADTQAEPASVYRWLDWLEKQLPFPVHRVSAGSLVEMITALRQKRDGSGSYVKSGVPAFTVNPDGSHGQIQRQCTGDFKIVPITREVRRLANIRRGEKEVRVIQWIGISLDELHRARPTGERWQRLRWPLIEMEMTRRDCAEWMKARGFPAAPRSACIFCPYKSDREWRRLRDEEPTEFARAVEVETRFRDSKAAGGRRGRVYFHASRVPLAEVDLSTDIERGQLELFGCTEGMCGV